MKVPTFLPAILLALFLNVSSAKKATFLTYNVQLSNLNDNRPNWTDRRDLIIDNLRDSKADVICLQEIWFSPDLVKMMKQLEDVYPYSFSSAHIENDLLSNRSKESICDPIEMAIFNAECQNASDIACQDVEGFYQRRLCRLKACREFVLKLQPDCRMCTTLTGQDKIRQVCLIPTRIVMNLYGTMVLSKKKIENASLVMFEGDVPEQDKLEIRGMLELDIKGINGKVACSLNTEKKGLIEEQIDDNLPGFRRKQDRNLGQIQEILTRYQNESNLVLMGSLGTGPKYKKRIEATFPQSYNALKNAVPALQRTKPRKATFISDGRFGSERTAVDHIFTRGHKMKKNGLAWFESSLSDHAAVKAAVKLAK